MKEVLSLLIAAHAPAAVATKPALRAPTCAAAQLRLSADGRDGEFNGMSHSGVELSIRSAGSDCALAALPVVEFRDGRGRLLRVVRQAPAGMHPGPVMVPIRIAAGHRVVTDIRWVSGPVFTSSASVRVASVSVRIGTALVRTKLTAMMFGESGKPVRFDQKPLRKVEGMAEG